MANERIKTKEKLKTNYPAIDKVRYFIIFSKTNFENLSYIFASILLLETPITKKTLLPISNDLSIFSTIKTYFHLIKIPLSLERLVSIMNYFKLKK